MHPYGFLYEFQLIWLYNLTFEQKRNKRRKTMTECFKIYNADTCIPRFCSWTAYQHFVCFFHKMVQKFNISNNIDHVFSKFLITTKYFKAAAEQPCWVIVSLQRNHSTICSISFLSNLWVTNTKICLFAFRIFLLSWIKPEIEIVSPLSLYR